MSNRRVKDIIKKMPTSVQTAHVEEDAPFVASLLDFEKEAIDRVYKKYGSDLGAFYRDVKQELALLKCED